MVDYSEQGWFQNAIRSLFAGLDSLVYKLLSAIYQIFFNVASADILKGYAVKSLVGRIQLILGIIIMFKLVISFFNGIMNPDSLKDSKNGMGSVIKRAAVVLVLMVLIVPLNIPGSEIGDEDGQKSWNKNLNTHGVIFGSLYELQKRILKGEVIPRLILGTASFGNTLDEGDKFARSILTTLVTVNVVEDGADISDGCESEDTKCVCKYEADGVDKALDVYFNEKSTTSEILSSKVINAYCSVNKSAEAVDHGFDNDSYAISYSWLWSTIVGALFCVLILSLTMDTAIRLFKLVILEIISPIAILSYIDPKGEKTFQNWVKAVTTTYLAIFIRVAIISFILFVVKAIAASGFGIETGNGFVGLISKLLIYLALIMFAREAPKFITSTLGIEQKEGEGLFSGLATLRNGIGGGLATIAGGISSARSARRASIIKDTNNSDEPLTRTNRAKANLAGLFSGISGAHQARTGYVNAKDHKWRSAIDPINRQNDARLRNAELGSAVFSNPIEQMRQDWTGTSTYGNIERHIQGLKAKEEKLQNQYDTYKSRMDAVSGLQQYGIDEALKKGNGFFKYNGSDIDIKNFNSAIEAAKAQGSTNVNFTDNSGNRLHISLDDAINNLGNYSKEAGADYLIRHINDTTSGVKEKVTAANYGAAPGQEIVIDANTLASSLNAEIGSLKGIFNKGMTDVMYGYTDANNNYQQGISDIKKDILEQTEKSKKAYATLAGNDNRPGGR